MDKTSSVVNTIENSMENSSEKVKKQAIGDI